MLHFVTFHIRWSQLLLMQQELYQGTPETFQHCPLNLACWCCTLGMAHFTPPYFR
jgi:hypothetical protein